MTRDRVILWGLVALVALAHLATVGVGIGSFWFADELIQYIEQPFRVLHGLPVSAWEFQEGTRNWTFPGAILAILWLCKSIGITDPLSVLIALRVVTKGLFMAAFVRAALALPREGDGLSAWLPLALLGLFPVTVMTTNHTLSETWSLIALLWGVSEWHAAQEGNERSAGLAGVGLGLAVLIRLQSVVLVPVLAIGIFWPYRQKSSSLSLLRTGAIGLGATLLAGAALDAVTYGSFAHSFVTALQAHFGDGGQLFDTMGIEPWHYFITHAVVAAPLASSICLALWVVGAWQGRRSPWPYAVLLFVLVHSFIPHKEMRFVLPALPFALLTAGHGLSWLLSYVARYRIKAAAVLPAIVVVAGLVPLFHALVERDREDAVVAQVLSEVRRLDEPAILAPITPGRTIWPALSRFVVGLDTRTTTRLTTEQLTAICHADYARGSLLLFGPATEVSQLEDTAKRAGCAIDELASTPPWLLLSLRSNR